MSIIEEIKQKTDIVEIVGQYVQLTKSGRTFRAPCPFHSEKKPSFFVYPEQQTWHCFGACNTGGDVFSFVMKKEGMEFGDALRLLAEKSGVAIPSYAKSEAEDKARERLFQITQSACQYFQNLLQNSPAAELARRYLAGRGLNTRAISDFQLGYSLPGWENLKEYLNEKSYSQEEMLAAGLIILDEKTGKTHDRFRHHIMFPISDVRGRVTGFGARVLDDSSPKYTNSPQTRLFDKSGTLYGFHLAKAAIREKNMAVMVEGYMDVIVAHQYGFNNVVAPMGVAITDKQLNQIKILTRNIALALDPDAAGEEATKRCVNYENTLDAEIKVITLPMGRDPDEVIKGDSAQWQAAVDRAVPVIEYTIKSVTTKLDLKTTVGKTEAVNNLLPIIAEVKAGPRQYDYLTRLSLAVGIEDKKLEAALGRFKLDRKARETRPQAIQKATRPIASSPIEEYVLSILLQHPDLKKKPLDLDLDYFENSENRDILNKWLQCADPAITKNLLDPALLEHFELLLTRELPGEQMEEKLEDCCLSLKERYLRNLQRKNTELLALEAESGDRDSVLARLGEQGTRINQELTKIFNLKAKAHGEVKK
jgi:DNA primase